MDNLTYPYSHLEGGQEGPIRCIFFCEFHPIAGPIIVCQVSTTIYQKT